MRRLAYLLPVLLTLAAAKDTGLGRAKYVPAAGAPTALARFAKGNLRLSIKRGDTQYYGVLAGDTCKSAQKLTIYSAGIGGNTTERVLPLAAGAPLRILASLQQQRNGGYQVELFGTCSRVAAFTPRPGRTYRITQEADADRPDFCALAVVDAASGQVPGDLTQGPALACHF